VYTSSASCGDLDRLSVWPYCAAVVCICPSARSCPRRHTHTRPRVHTSTMWQSSPMIQPSFSFSPPVRAHTTHVHAHLSRPLVTSVLSLYSNRYLPHSPAHCHTHSLFMLDGWNAYCEPPRTLTVTMNPSPLHAMGGHWLSGWIRSSATTSGHYLMGPSLIRAAIATSRLSSRSVQV
jgi:hypothetical protein